MIASYPSPLLMEILSENGGSLRAQINFFDYVLIMFPVKMFSFYGQTLSLKWEWGSI